MNPEDWMGGIVSFYFEPEKAVIGCVAQEGIKAVCGQVVGTFKVDRYQGKLKDLGLLVRGRSGKKIKVTVVTNYVKKHKNYKEADASINQTTK